MFGAQNNNAPKDDSTSDLNIQNPQQNPTDSVSTIEWFNSQNPQQRMFACGCWDGKVKVYNVTQQGIAQSMEINVNECVLDLAWNQDGSMIFVAAGQSLKIIQTANQQVVEFGQHQAGISNVFWSQNHQMIITTSFDKTLKFWSLQQQGQPIKIHTIGKKIYCADVLEDCIILALQNEKIMIDSLNNLKNNQQINQNNMFDSSNLGQGSQINSIKLTKYRDGKMVYAVASIDGRANLSSFQPKQQGGWNCESIMTFKCHKEEKPGQNNQNTQIMHTVNAIGFNPMRNDYFVYTVGAEGKMFFWDINEKNKIKTFNFNNQPITAASVSGDGQCIAYALGYDWHAGYESAKNYQTFKVCVHGITDQEIKYVGNKR